jgi:hypothetical protein
LKGSRARFQGPRFLYHGYRLPRLRPSVAVIEGLAQSRVASCRSTTNCCRAGCIGSPMPRALRRDRSHAYSGLMPGCGLRAGSATCVSVDLGFPEWPLSKRKPTPTSPLVLKGSSCERDRCRDRSRDVCRLFALGQEPRRFFIEPDRQPSCQTVATKRTTKVNRTTKAQSFLGKTSGMWEMKKKGTPLAHRLA